MSTNFDMIVSPNPADATVNGDAWTITVLAYPSGTIVDPLNPVLPAPISVQVSGGIGDPDAEIIAAAGAKVQEVYSQQLRSSALGQRLGAYIGKIIPVTVQDVT